MVDRRRWRRGARWAFPVTVALAGAASHLFFWYLPRARSATPSGESLPAQLVLAPSDARLAIWLAFPHQNLGAVERQLGDLEGTLGSLADLMDLETMLLPRFGPFRFPPAREMALAIHDPGERLVLAIRFYPAVRWLLRAAGIVAGNPWLAGGQLALGRRELSVSWQDGVWIAKSNDLQVAPSSSAEAAASSLALVRLGDDRGPIAAGLYRLTLDGSSLVAVSEPAFEAPRLFAGPREELPVAALWAQFGESADRDTARALAVLAGNGAAQPLGQVAVLHRGPGDRWRLPGERLLKAAGSEVRRRDSGQWSVFAYEEVAFAAAEPVLATLREWDRQRRALRLRGAAEVNLTRAREAILELASMLERVPVLGPRESRRWLALAGLLEAFKGFDRLSVRVAATGRVEIRIEPGRPD